MLFCFYSSILGFRSSRLHVSYGRLFAIVFSVFIVVTLDRPNNVLMYAIHDQPIRARNDKGVIASCPWLVRSIPDDVRVMSDGLAA